MNEPPHLNAELNLLPSGGMYCNGVVVENKANLRCRQRQGRRPEAKGIPTASSLRPFPVSNEPNFAGLAGGGPKRRAKAFTHNCLGVNWGNVGVVIEGRMKRNQAQRLELGGPYHEDLQGFLGIDNRGRYRRLRDGRGQ